MVNEAMFSSASEEWETPKWLFDELDNEFHFNLDPCASRGNAKCERYFTKEDDGLTQDWEGIVFVNSPYGRAIGNWVRKAYTSAAVARTATVVCLIPARTDTRWWWEFVSKGEVRFIKGRLKFGGGKHSAPFPSAIVIFRRGDVRPKTIYWTAHEQRKTG